MWKEKAQTVLDGRDNHCPESKTGEDALLAGSRERFPELELEVHCLGKRLASDGAEPGGGTPRSL